MIIPGIFQNYDAYSNNSNKNPDISLTIKIVRMGIRTLKISSMNIKSVSPKLTLDVAYECYHFCSHLTLRYRNNLVKKIFKRKQIYEKLILDVTDPTTPKDFENIRVLLGLN